MDPVINWPIAGRMSPILWLGRVTVSEEPLQGGCFRHVHLKREDLSGQSFNTSFLKFGFWHGCCSPHTALYPLWNLDASEGPLLPRVGPSGSENYCFPKFI